MGLFDRFKKPDINSNNYKLRIKAIELIDDENELIKIVQNDPDREVRLSALNKINNPSFLGDLLIKYSKKEVVPVQEYLYLIKNVPDNMTLAKVAVNVNLEYLFDNVVEYIDDENTFKYIYLSCDRDKLGTYKRKISMEKINSENILFDIAMKEDNYFLSKRLYETKKIKNKNLLENFAEKSNDPAIRSYFINVIDNQTVLKRISLNDSNKDVVNKALKRITYKEDDLQYMLKHESSYVRTEAIKITNDENVLKEIAKKDKDKKVRMEAIKKLGIEKFYDDEDVLTDVTLGDFYVTDKMSLEALRKISNPDLIKKIAKDTNYNTNNIKIAAIKKIDDDEFLKNLLLEYSHNFNDNLTKTRKRAGVSYNSMLKNQYSNHSVCKVIVRNIKDEQVLINYYEYQKDKVPIDTDARRIIIENMPPNKEFLKKVSEDKDELMNVQEAAKSRL